MKAVIAAVDASAMAERVLACAGTVAPVLAADVEAMYVQEPGGTPPTDAAERAGVPLRICQGDVVECLVEAGQPDDAVAMVLGARDDPVDRRPLGATAFAVATTSRKPIVVVPPGFRPGTPLRRVLIPLEGNVPTSLAPQSLLELAGDAELDVIALHVIGPENPLPFLDQPQYEREIWGREFLARYCPWGLDLVRFETRVGMREELIPRAAREFGCDLIVLGWWRTLSGGRARVVNATLRRSGVPVMLFPLPSLDRVGTPT